MKLVRWSLLGGLLLLLGSSLVHGAEGVWGDVKGQVVWGGGAIPAAKKLVVDKDKAACLAKGDLLDPSYSVDPKTKGVRWVMVWLADKDKPLDPTVAIPINPKLKALKEKDVEVDQPCCLYEPYVFGIRVGQSVLAKNSSTIAHNVKVDGGTDNPNVNILIPAGQQVPIPGWKPTKAAPVLFSCSIHGWMKGYARVFNHPYFAVTNDKGEFEIKDAPAGKYRLVVWHPEFGWVTGDGDKPDRKGKVITIKAGGATDLGKISLKPAP